MNDEQLDHLLDDAATRWRASAPPLDAIWDGVQQELDAPAARRAPGWWGVAAAAAIALAVGIAGGRMTAHGAPIASALRRPAASSATPVVAVGNADNHAMGELLGRTAVLLAALPHDSGSAPVDRELTQEGARLLTTTRLLLDSRAGTDPRLRTLLQDLELVLAQVARLQPEGPQVEMQFIQTTLDEHDLVPRLRSAAADFSLDDL